MGKKGGLEKGRREEVIVIDQRENREGLSLCIVIIFLSDRCHGNICLLYHNCEFVKQIFVSLNIQISMEDMLMFLAYVLYVRDKEE